MKVVFLIEQRISGKGSGAFFNESSRSIGFLSINSSSSWSVFYQAKREIRVLHREMLIIFLLLYYFLIQL